MKPWLLLPPSWSHKFSEYFLSLFGHACSPHVPTWQPFEWRGLNFPNRLGIAGGVDKNAEFVKAFWALGAGFLEVGTVTPNPQEPNPGKILDRDVKTTAVWNKMGFPSKGMNTTAHNLSCLLQRPTPIFINVGKNRLTPNENAHEDYLKEILFLAPYADAFVINISSPNTKDLRQIQSADVLKSFLSQILGPYRNQKLKPIRPILVKLSPDLSHEELKKTLDVCVEQGIDGWILSNTTLQRPKDSPFPIEGGVSGKPVSDLAKAQLRLAISHLGPHRQGKLIISVGGILTPKDIEERLALGADLVEVYAALIFYGPKFFADSAKYFISVRLHDKGI